jgi:Asp-tRNA(Asn)/Glu-tRNA(Gln) amidotransferase C subunit
MDFTEEQFREWCRLSGLNPGAEHAEALKRDLQHILELTKKMETPPEGELEPLVSPVEKKGELRKDNAEPAEELENEMKMQVIHGEKFFTVKKDKKNERLYPGVEDA